MIKSLKKQGLYNRPAQVQVASVVILLLLAVLPSTRAWALDEANRFSAISLLSEKLDAVLQAGEAPKVWLTVLGQNNKPYEVLKCDEKTITISLENNPFPVKWAELKPEDLAGIAKATAGDKGERLFTAAEVAFTLGFSDRACEILATIRNPDDSLKMKINTLALEISKTAPAKKESTAGPKPPATPIPVSQTPATPAKSTEPPPIGTSPAITGPVINVGATRAIKTITAGLAKAKAGDTILVDLGTYKEAFKMQSKGKENAPVTILGMSGPNGERPVVDGDGISVSGAGPVPRALIQIEGDYCVVEHIEVKNARNGNNGAGFRFLFCNYAIVRDCKITYCDMGFMGGDKETACVQRCEVAFNGTKDFNGYSHNFYMNGNKLIVQECYIHDSLFGQNFKTRGHYTELWYNFIADSEEGELGFPDSDESGKPNSSTLMVGNVVVSKSDRKGNASKYIDFGGEGKGRTGNLYLFNNTFIAGSPRINFVHLAEAGEELIASNNIFLGSPKVAGGKVKGSNNLLEGDVSGLTGSLHAKDPLFIGAATHDYHLQAGSPCANAGAAADALSYVDGDGKTQKALPSRQVEFPMKSVPRPKKAGLDIGAYGL
jgi:hypothetical protein